MGNAEASGRDGELNVVAAGPGHGDQRPRLWAHDAESEHREEVPDLPGSELP